LRREPQVSPQPELQAQPVSLAQLRRQQLVHGLAQ
jgi:hypothetical protein